MLKNIILVGFRYTGKSKIGKCIAKINDLKFIDLDLEIQKELNQSVSEITKNGQDWRKFREIEFKLFKKFLNQKNILLSCGGGVGVNEFFGDEQKNLLQKLKNSLRILFDINQKCLEERMKKSHSRPNIGDSDTIDLFKKRANLYDLIDYDCKIDMSYNAIDNAIKRRTLCCVIGDPVWHSLSPKIHNDLYKKNKINNKFIYTKIHVRERNFDKIRDIIFALNIRSASITSPYKEKIMKYLDKIDDFSTKIEAVNTVINVDKILHGYNTDQFGVRKALEEKCDIIGKKIAIFGSGGAAKSAVVGLLMATNKICIFNRTRSKNDFFAKKNGIKSCELSDFDPKDFDIIINATKVGFESDESILDAQKVLSKNVIFDMIYNPLETKLLKIAKEKNAKRIFGTEMLKFQAEGQFRIYYKQFLSKIDEKKRECIVVIGQNIEEFLKNMKKAQKLGSFIELRVDYIRNLSIGNIETIAKNLNVDAIFTCRIKKHGGEFIDDVIKNKKIIHYAINLNKFAYFDIDVDKIDDFYDLFVKNIEKLIISYHNFKITNNINEMKKIIHKMNKFRHFAKKIAINVNNDIFYNTTIDYIVNLAFKERVIFTFMSDSKIIRLLCFVFSSWTNYFSLNEKKKTAKGQLSIEEFKRIKDLI